MTIQAELAGELTQRQLDIVRIVGEQGYATIDALAHRFTVSAQSIRRDIIQLDRMRLLQRFRDQHPRAAELIAVAETTMACWWRRIASFGRRSG